MKFLKKQSNLIFAIVSIFIIGSFSLVVQNQLNASTKLPFTQETSIEIGQVDKTVIDFQEKIKDFQTKNQDAIGWLSLPNCDIDDVILQSDDNDYYLRRTENKQQDIWGCYFLDYINNHDSYVLSDDVSIIYGHALNDDPESEKFSKLKRYKNSDFANANRSFTFALLNRTVEYQIFSACEIPVSIDYIDPNPNSEKYQATLDYMINNSYFDFGVEVSTDDQILILSTCTSKDDVRFVVATKLP